MLNGPIPSHVDPRRLADRAITLEGDIALSELSRLCSSLVSNQGIIHAKLVFSRDQQRLPVIQATLAADLSMLCQRCLEPVVLPVHGEFLYAVLGEGASSESLPQGYDALELGEEDLDLLSLIEDELLLALPLVPAHDPKDCQHPAGFVATPEPAAEAAAKPNPFSVLAQLKRDPNV